MEKKRLVEFSGLKQKYIYVCLQVWIHSWLHDSSLKWCFCKSPRWESTVVDEKQQNKAKRNLHLLWRKQPELTWHMTLSSNGCHNWSLRNRRSFSSSFLFLYIVCLHALLITATNAPIKPSNSLLLHLICLLTDRGPSVQHKNTAARLSTRGAGTEQSPLWLLFSSSEWHYWNPSPSCMHLWRP